VMVRNVADYFVYEEEFIFRCHLNDTDVSEIRDLKSCVIMDKETSNILLEKWKIIQ
jgi:hypothetical protein